MAVRQVYTPLFLRDGTKHYLKFFDEHIDDYRNEIKDIFRRLIQIGKTTGAREGFFKHE
jgi:hypothetical protein